VGFIKAGSQTSTPTATDGGPAQPTPDNSTAEPAQPASDNSATEPTDGFNPDSTEIFLPYLLSKNPYEWAEHSGILDTRNPLMLMPNGIYRKFPQLGPSSIRFDKMLDEHTAVYDVMTIDQAALAAADPDYMVPDGQIAVILPDSTPPSLAKPWKVLVEGPVTGTNAFGADLTVTTVKFEGYYDPPQPPAPVPAPTTMPAGPAQSNTMQPFTSANGRFSVLFRGTPQQSSQTVHLENSETTMQYRFACADNGTSYFVTYADYPPDVVGPSPQAFLQGDENVSVNGKTLLTDAAINLDGAPGRAFTFTCSYADGSIRSCNVHAFLAGTRLYTLMVVAQKGDTATQADQFMNSFRIF
jgi:hypothetical protein